MIRFLVRRIFSAIPTLIGISVVTFVLLNLAMDSADPGAAGGSGLLVTGSTTGDDLARMHGLHLPLFVNLSIEDVAVHAELEVAALDDPNTRARAMRSLSRRGGAVLPYLLNRLDELPPERLEHVLAVLAELAGRIDVDRALAAAPDPVLFWKRYWDTHDADFAPARAARLVHRLVRRDDQLALSELRRLDTFCLPQLMDALDEEPPPEAQARLIGLAGQLLTIDDPLDPRDPELVRAATVARWQEWWQRHYDQFTTFEGTRQVSGALTETRYFRWLARMTTLDFGVSTRDNRPIATKLAERLPVTLLLSLIALIFAYAAAVPLGIFSAINEHGLFDRITTMAMFVLFSLPAFWVAMLLLRYFAGAGYLDLFPAQGLSTPGAEEWPFWRRMFDTAHHLILPVLCLSYVSLAMLTRYQRVGMLQVIGKDYMRTARAKGLTRTRAILRHGLRNGLIPVVTMLGMQLPYLVSGSVVVERIFGIPGMGLETFEAIRAHDHPWLLAVVTVTAVMTMFGVVASDAIYAWIDPRIAPGRRREGS